jgi:hypothetical protein
MAGKHAQNAYAAPAIEHWYMRWDVLQLFYSDGRAKYAAILEGPSEIRNVSADSHVTTN